MRAIAAAEKAVPQHRFSWFDLPLNFKTSTGGFEDASAAGPALTAAAAEARAFRLQLGAHKGAPCDVDRAGLVCNVTGASKAALFKVKTSTRMNELEGINSSAACSLMPGWCRPVYQRRRSLHRN